MQNNKTNRYHQNFCSSLYKNLYPKLFSFIFCQSWTMNKFVFSFFSFMYKMQCLVFCHVLLYYFSTDTYIYIWVQFEVASSKINMFLQKVIPPPPSCLQGLNMMTVSPAKGEDFCLHSKIKKMWCPGYDTELQLMVKLQFWRSEECSVLLHCHYSQVYTNWEGQYLLCLIYRLSKIVLN